MRTPTPDIYPEVTCPSCKGRFDMTVEDARPLIAPSVSCPFCNTSLVMDEYDEETVRRWSWKPAAGTGEAP